MFPGPGWPAVISDTPPKVEYPGRVTDEDEFFPIADGYYDSPEEATRNFETKRDNSMYYYPGAVFLPGPVEVFKETIRDKIVYGWRHWISWQL